MKQSEDDLFDYKFTWVVGGSDKGWTFHYRPKHLPLSAEMSSLLAFLQLRPFNECPEYDFAECFWRFCHFVDTGSPLHEAAEIAHGWFQEHASKFALGLQKLLDANGTLASLGFELLPSVSANVPPEVIQPPAPRKDGKKSAAMPELYDVAISFAGAQRPIAEAIAQIVKNAGFVVFYDDFYPEQLWGKDLAVFFGKIFRTQARFCVIIVSPEYLNGEWTNHERQSAVERAIKERGGEYILPIKLGDDLDLPGVPGTVGYVSFNKYSVEHIADMLIKKLKA